MGKVVVSFSPGSVSFLMLVFNAGFGAKHWKKRAINQLSERYWSIGRVLFGESRTL
jgi:hypothetical protein